MLVFNNDKRFQKLSQINETEYITDTNKLYYNGKGIVRTIIHIHKNDTIHADVKARNNIHVSDSGIK